MPNARRLLLAALLLGTALPASATYIPGQVGPQGPAGTNGTNGTNGSAAFNLRTISTGSTDTATDTLPVITLSWASTTAAAKTENLPACVAANKNQTFNVADTAGTFGTYNMTVTPNGTDKIINAGSSVSSLVLSVSGESISFQCNGAAAWILI